MSKPDGESHSKRKIDNAETWRATIPIKSHDFPSNVSVNNINFILILTR